jgi:hypothetical protein
VNDLSVWQGEKSSPFAKTDNNVGLGNKVIEPFHKIFGDEVCPTLLIIWILHDWTKHLIADSVHVFEDILCDF